MAKIVISDSDPIPPDPSDQPRNNDALWYDLVSWTETERLVEIIVQFLPSGELQRFLRYHDPKTNTEKRETRAAKKILDKLIPPGTADKMMGLDSATHSSKERAHRRRKTRALGNKLRAGAQRRDEAKRKEL
jgi:hypothetical protein